MLLDATTLQTLYYFTNHYSARGFKAIDVPWLIGKEALLATLPPGLPELDTVIGSLPGSGEQSFIQLMLEGKLAPGKYQCLTPCFRPEPVLDETHLYAFFKLELINYKSNPTQEDAKFIAEQANTLYKWHFPTKLVALDNGTFDIESSTGLELGSYGIRHFKEHSWVYGTGLAFPRFTMALKAYHADPSFKL